MRPKPLMRLQACLAAAIACIPLLCSRFPPLYDYPAHLARMRITVDLLTQRHFAAMYALHPAVIPNLATDMFIIPLALLGLNIETAGRLCLCALILGLGVGVIRLNRALTGGASALPLLAFGLAYAEPFQFGFMNYVAGVAVLLNALAFWVAAENRTIRLTIIGILACTLLFFCHLIACVLFIGSVLTIEAFDATRALLAKQTPLPNIHRAAALLPGMLAAFLLYKAAPLANQGANDSFIKEFLAHTPSKRERLLELIHALNGYNPWLDLAEILLIVLILAVLLMRNRLRVNVAMLPVLAGITLVFALFPDHWAGTSYIADRLPFVIGLLALSSVDATFTLRRNQLAFSALILALVLTRGITASVAWHEADIAYAPLLTALGNLPPGAKIYTGTDYRFTTKAELRQPFTHITAYAPLRNIVFDAGVFADPSQNIVVRTPPYEAIGKLAPLPFRSDLGAMPTPENDIFAPPLLAAYDYVLAVHPEQYPKPLPANLTIVAASGPAVLYGISH